MSIKNAKGGKKFSYLPRFWGRIGDAMFQRNALTLIAMQGFEPCPIAIQWVILLSKLNGLCLGIVSNNSLTTGRI